MIQILKVKPKIAVSRMFKSHKMTSFRGLALIYYVDRARNKKCKFFMSITKLLIAT